MQNHYLNVRLNSYAEKEEMTENAVDVTLISKAETNTPWKTPFSNTINKAFSEKKTQLWTSWTDKKEIIVALPHQNLEKIRLVGAKIYNALKNDLPNQAILKGLENLTKESRLALLEGILLSSYHFDKYYKEKDAVIIDIYLADSVISKEEIKELTILAKAISLTKNLVNEPPNYMNSLQFSLDARKAGQKFGFETEVLEKDKIEELKMGGLLGVNQGSSIPPTFNIFTYKPKNALNKKPLILVGKGVMFDTGGYSLKIGGVMSSMKSDMAGGAAVLGIISAIAGNNLPYYIIGLVPATDNKISGQAMVVDDVITMMNGTTVEVQNTDAEGRLVLADALAYAKQFDPELVIDIATLTGASAAITGSFGISVLGKDQENIDQLSKIGEKVYERLVQLPLWKEYADLLKSEVADLQNIGGKTGGVSTAAKFLEHFTDYPWIHFDIAGAAFIKKANGYKQSGATAVPLRLIYDFVKSKC